MSGWLQFLRGEGSESLASSLARLFYFSQHVLNCTIVVPKIANQSTDNQEFVDSYSNTFYWIMLKDAVRMAAYEAAGADPALCRDKRFVDIGTGARMPLSLMVLRGAAAQVDAIEGNQATYRHAATLRESLAAAVRDRIRLHLGLSTDIELSPRADALIHEIIGTVASSEGMARCVADAQERLLVPGALIIPERVATTLVPVSRPPIRPTSAIVSWLATGEKKLARGPGVQVIYNPSKLARLGSTPVVIEQFDCAAGAPPMRSQLTQRTRHTIAMERDGWFSGFLLGCHIVTGEGIPAIDSLNQLTNWGQLYAQMVETPVRVARGDTVLVEFHVDAREFTPSYRLSVTLPRSSKPNEIRWEGTGALVP